MPIYKFYIPWDPDMLIKGVQQLLSNFGVIINVGIWGFLAITGVYLAIKIFNSLFS